MVSVRASRGKPFWRFALYKTGRCKQIVGMSEESVFYGRERVAPETKKSRVEDLFGRVAPSYDVMNDVMSGGLHRLWKDSLIRQIRPRPHWRYLDLAGGTGDIAFRIREKTGPGTKITIADLTPAMLEEGRKRAIDRGWLNDFEWVEANAENLPFADNEFDIVTIAFGLRNVPRIDLALKEAHRVLAPGGRFFCLEFSPIENPLLRQGYDLYTRACVPLMGRLIAKDQAAYDYLLDSIETFPHAETLVSRMREAGLADVRYSKRGGGVVAIHQGIKT